jgi:hypothetical protein
MAGKAGDAGRAGGDGQTVPWPSIGLIALLVAVVMSTGPARAQMRGGPSRSTDRVVSPTVVASFITHTEYSVGRFTLLVLWRGSEGWFMRGGGHSGGGSGGGGGNSGESRGSQYFSYGGVSFTLEFNWTAATVKLLDREISLRETNLILVDNVDTPSGLTIVDQRRIDVPIELDDQVDSIRALIGRSPELFAYLQCDKQLPDAFQQAMIAIVCNQMRPQ